ncbi:plasma protease C1 inhibitor [Mugil cephalus]|uniref:plasma protease C1 inhibitor n=1 Tax=Mugil cephalus TaxID=48193 RepID=UPI001FB842A2|nr:plasma protease C1 inhibitor [Mugil cephalus]
MRRQAILCLLLQLIFELSSCTRLRVTPGSTLELPCLSFQSDFAAEEISWKFNGEDLSVGIQSHGSVSIKQNGLVLSISPVTAANEGGYECLIKESNMELVRVYNITVDAPIAYAIKVTEGTSIRLPCYLQPSTQAEANALWFRVTGAGGKTQLSLEEDSAEDFQRMEQLYPNDPDQTIIIRNVGMKDTGTYQCESTAGEKLSTVDIIVVSPPTSPPFTCSTDAWEPCQDENSRTGGPMLQESVTEFSMKLFSYLREIYPNTNLLFSPVSIDGALSHLLLGARDDTRRAIQQALCVSHDFYCVHFQMKKLREKLSDSLQMASQIFYSPQMNLSESFNNQSIEFYEAKPMKLLETNEQNTAMINSWVANKTKSKITHLVDSVSPLTQLILLNAVSFNGQWKVKFRSRKGLFQKLDGDLVPVSLLFHSKYPLKMGYVAELKAQVAKFALTGKSSLYIILPRTYKPTDLQQVEDKMTDVAVYQMIEEMERTEVQHVEVSLPKVKLDVQPDMNILLKKLGLSSLYEGANLCGLYSEDRLVLDEAKHRAYFELNEQGVEAGAATSLSFSRSFPTFSAMRPFILLLWSDQANVPLFVGRVTEP